MIPPLQPFPWRRGAPGEGLWVAVCLGYEIWYLGDEKNEWVFVYE